MPEDRVACSLDPQDRERRFGEFAELAAAGLLESARTPHGARLLLRQTDAIRASLDRLIEAERRCCAFLEFAVEIEEDGIRVEVTGPPSARLLIDRLFDLELAAAAE